MGLTTEVHPRYTAMQWSTVASNSLLKGHSRGTLSCGLKCGQYSKYNIKKHIKIVTLLANVEFKSERFSYG